MGGRRRGGKPGSEGFMGGGEAQRRSNKEAEAHLAAAGGGAAGVLAAAAVTGCASEVQQLSVGGLGGVLSRAWCLCEIVVRKQARRRSQVLYLRCGGADFAMEQIEAYRISRYKSIQEK